MTGATKAIAGFTLLELTVSMAILSVVGILSLLAVRTAASSAELADAQAQVQNNVRDAMRVVASELQLAAKRPNAALSPALQDTVVTANPVAGAPVEVGFQIPLDSTGTRWSTRIRYRFVNEDANGNARLDAGEDTDHNGVLTRRIVRLQDRNGDGDSIDVAEQGPIGGANDLSSVTMSRTGDVVTISMTATKLVGRSRAHPVRATVTERVYLVN